MLSLIIDMLALDDWIGRSKNIDIAKGANKMPITFKEGVETTKTQKSMAVEKVITVKANLTQADKSFEELGEIIQEQKDITIEFKKELLALENQLAKTSKADLSRQKDLRDKITHVKVAIKEQGVAIQDLNNQKSKSNKEDVSNIGNLRKQSVLIRTLNKFTGGLASEFLDVAKAAKKGGAAMRAAILTTGVGILVVALGAIVSNWEEISEWIGLTNKDLERQQELLNQNLSLLDSEFKLLEAQIKLAKKRGESTDELVKKQKELLKLRRADTLDLIENLKLQLEKEKSAAREATWYEKFRGRKGVVTEEELILISKAKELLTDTKKKLVDIDSLLFGLDQPEAKKRPQVKVKEKREKEVSSGFGEQLQRDRDLEQKFLDLKLEFLNKELEILRKQEDDKFKISVDSSVKTAKSLQAARELEQTKKRVLAEEEQARDEALAVFKINTAKNALNLIGAIAKEGSDIAKGVQVAQAIISGIEGVQAAFTTASKSPITTFFPAYPFVQAGIAGAFSAVQIQKILAVKPQAGGGASFGGGQISAPQAPSFNVVGTSGVNQIAQGLAQQDEPIRAYVTGSNVTTQQALDRNIIETATIG